MLPSDSSARVVETTISNDFIGAGSFSGVIRGRPWSFSIHRRVNTAKGNGASGGGWWILT